MLKKMTIAALAVAALAAIAAPSASATFRMEGLAILQNETETFTGTLVYQNASLGSFHCTNSEIQIQLLAGQTNGTVQKFQVNNPTQNCDLKGTLGAACGTNAVNHVYLLKHAAAQVVTQPAGTAALKLQNFDFYTQFGSTASPCVQLTLQDVPGQDFLLTPENPNEISTVNLAGKVQDSKWGVMTFNGQFHAHNPGTYGIEPI
jgi:hypothetical protein